MSNKAEKMNVNTTRINNQTELLPLDTLNDDNNNDTFKELSQLTNATNNSTRTISLRQDNRSHIAITAAVAAATAASDASSSTLDRWQPQPHWSIAPGGKQDHNHNPDLTSSHCYDGLVHFFDSSRQSPKGAMILSLVTEASSHPSGLTAVYGQPWVYAGPGLGNMDECPLQVCLAGGTGRDSLTFASVCIVPDCDANDLLALDFAERIQTASAIQNIDYVYHQNQSNDEQTESLIQEYVRLHQQIAKVGQFLGTGWVCGDYRVDWEWLPSLLWGFFLLFCIICSAYGTFGPPSHNQQRRKNRTNNVESTSTPTTNNRVTMHDTADAEMCGLVHSDSLLQNSGTSNPTQDHISTADMEHRQNTSLSFWSAWNMTIHLNRMIEHRPETACLDGLKVGSILWIMAAHVMAIQSSTAAGYLNPSDFLPPHGITTTFLGQLLFSSRYAVDTFLCISGYLAVYVLKRKLKKWDTTTSSNRLAVLAGVLVMRILRILPLYMFCLGFWMYIAPHLGSGPFWYQWENFLEPCRHSWWTNLLFVNNFLPWGVSTTANCFYHSWYLAVDVQLFFLFSPWLVLLFHRLPIVAQRVTKILWISSVVMTAVLSYTRQWSVNTFDGAAVALFDVEGYAKPHIRAQSYLAGMLVAMLPKQQRTPKRRFLGLGCDMWLMTLPLICLFILSFVTVTGAYTRRACTFEELPAYDNCGSEWSNTATFLYAAFSRAIWSICIALIMTLCLEHKDSSIEIDDPDKDETTIGGDPQYRTQHCSSIPHYLENPVKFVLSWNVWTPLAHLSFGAYLIHPIVIIVWKLGGREKTAFRVLSFVMDVCSITVVTFIFSLIVALVVEFPFGAMLNLPLATLFQPTSMMDEKGRNNDERSSLLRSSIPFNGQRHRYGT